MNDDRKRAVAQALRLEYLTIGWNIVEGVVAVTAAILAGSVALLGFGIDSFVESASGGVLVWRLLAERRGADHEAVERLDARAHKLVGASLFLLAAYVAFDGASALWAREEPRPSVVGIVLTAVSIVAMQWLARAKRRAAKRLGSRALETDAFQTTACFWLSIITLGGIGLNAALGWWWADPVAALGMTVYIAREGMEAWRGEGCGCEDDMASAALAPDAQGETSCGGGGCACAASRSEHPEA
ncbi:cation diffusion facilitator family transporter [Anaeromyxobacter oryzisoli]|uniref:cation diffusion facilitator family transporter n=1 Tax=Anaeromyxobacter oryzisoli TaxID=2925408 RepID=UPI001F5A4432|nr:cation transporter [Anaeromyxobacter sp. SG63]